MLIRDVGGLVRALLRRAAVPLVLLGLLVLYARGGPAVPTLGAGTLGGAGANRSLPLPSASLHYLLGEGLPTLGGMRPAQGPFGIAGEQIAAIGAYAFLGLLPHDPLSLFESAFVGFGLSPNAAAPASSSLAQWLVELPQPAAAAAPPRHLDQGLQVYGGGTPLVGLYATEGLAAYIGHKASASQPPPTSQDPGDNVLGVVRALGRELARDGVPTVASLQKNDSEGELGVYLKSYAVARSILRAEPQLAILLDVERPTFPEVPATVKTGAGPVASVSLAVGTGANLPEPNAGQNLQLARSLGSYLQARLPGVFRGIVRSPDRLNQQLSPTMLTIDIGGPQATPEQVQAVLPGVAGAIADFLGGAPVP